MASKNSAFMRMDHRYYEILYLSLVVEPLDHFWRLEGLHHAGEVDEAAPGVEEHLGAA